MKAEKLSVPPRHLFAGQVQHVLLLACLLPGAVYLAQPALDGSAWLGIDDRTWFEASLVVAVAHQVLGWFVFRTQLVYGLLTRWFGRHDLLAWGVLFIPLLILRLVLVVGLAAADGGSLGLPGAVGTVLGLVLLLPAAYTAWSIHKYFGFTRAIGGDHFRQHYRALLLVAQGAFRFSPNAMYAFGFLALWAVALLADSRAALASALFQHAYIWVHMYCTEEPDMRVIYGGSGLGRGDS